MSKEAMKLALNKAFQLGKRYWSWADSEYASHRKKADAAKAEFDQLVQDTINAALAEQSAQQEPYCYVYTENGEEYFAPPTGYFPDDATPLYTSPQLAQRKPLTDEQREQIYQEWASKPFDEASYDDLMLAVEAAHGIKENT